MDTNTPTNPQYKQVTVDVPEDRVAEFHAFFGRFLAGPTARGRRGRHGRPHRGSHGGCARRREASEPSEASAQPGAPDEPTEV